MHLKSLAGRVAGYGNRQDGTRNSKIGEKSRGKYKSRSNADQEPGVLSVRPGEIAVPRHEAQSLDHHRCAPPQGSHRATHEGPDPDSSAPRTEIALAENGEASLGKGPTLELVWAKYSSHHFTVPQKLDEPEKTRLFAFSAGVRRLRVHFAAMPAGFVNLSLVCGELLILGKSVIRHTHPVLRPRSVVARGPCRGRAVSFDLPAVTTAIGGVRCRRSSDPGGS